MEEKEPNFRGYLAPSCKTTTCCNDRRGSFSTEIELIYKVVLVSGVQQSDSVIHTGIFFLSDAFPLGFLRNTELSSLCYTVGPGWLSVLYTVVCIR